MRRDDELTDGIRKMNTYRVPFGVNFFHPSGLSASASTTFYDQEGTFDRTSGVRQAGDDSFWLFDAAVNYRLPKRYGFITIGARNLFDQKFKYYDTDWQNPSIQPDRFFFAKITLALP
jgi:outer membrane receptor protein involved in Fe transport